MTNRIKGFTVSLKENIRIDDCEQIINAIKMVKGVLDVAPLISGSEDFAVRSKVKSKIRGKIFNLLDEIDDL